MKDARLALLLAAALAAAACSSSTGEFEPIVLDLSKKSGETAATTAPPAMPDAGTGMGASVAGDTAPKKPAPKGAPAAPAAAPLPADLKGMSLEERVGQLFAVAGHGIFLNDEAPALKELVRQVTENRVGGIVWFRSNVYETALLNAKLQRLAKVPLLVSADLEAGAGMRFDDVTFGPWAMAVAATGDPSLETRRSLATATAARALGVHQVFAPVADVNVNPDNPVINVRSYGEDPADVSRFVAAAVKGLQDGGVLATLKHFPGHGDTSVDSHRALPVLAVGRDRLDAVELPPFKAGLAAGARSVMVAHVALPAIDPAPAPPFREAAKGGADAPTPAEVPAQATVPASLSAPVVTGLLRGQLGFGGLVVTDALRMNGVASYYDPGEAAILALLAGVDMVLLPGDADAAVKAVLAAVKSGRLPEARINQAAGRVLAEEKRLGLAEKAGPEMAAIPKVVGSPESDAVEEEIARRSLTLVRETAGTLPFRKEAKLLSLVVADEATLNGPAGSLTAELKARVPSVRTLRLDPRSTPDEVRAAVDAAKQADAVLVSLFVRARSGQGPVTVPESAKSAVPQLLALGKPVAAVAFGSPYLLRDFPDLPTWICAWGSQDVMQKAAAKALFGEAAFEGKLPVSIPGLARRGDGIAKAALPSK
ncbi:MAG TPA: glycoside hydrolase family 3 N-terminal domain-containing protein [Thermoanaerobaculia bacterium]|nr:glycoside hydrolase family 3 N-terminal domain-containing protein [Thermoanaerobaculia bacterium]